jgi:bifunctional non-homologous end joining protein LigD
VKSVSEPAATAKSPKKKLRMASARSRKAADEAISFLKTTGGKGLHVVVPFAPGPSWAEAKNFARTVTEVLAKAEPDHFTINSRKDVRAGRIFIDYLRNDETASAVAAYSVRARPGAPVSMPIDWRELSGLKSGDAFNMKDALKRRKDSWKDLAKATRQRLPLGMGVA